MFVIANMILKKKKTMATSTKIVTNGGINISGGVVWLSEAIIILRYFKRLNFVL